jgi:hypothetical protein
MKMKMKIKVKSKISIFLVKTLKNLIIKLINNKKIN